jgi:DNA replication initiation complex subunit (GINS family)
MDTLQTTSDPNESNQINREFTRQSSMPKLLAIQTNMFWARPLFGYEGRQIKNMSEQEKKLGSSKVSAACRR